MEVRRQAQEAHNRLHGRQGLHLMQTYAGSFPAQRVAEFIEEGRRAGEQAVVVATGDHVQRLRQMTSTDPQLKPILYIDADEALNGFLVDGWPDPKRFDQTIGATVRAASGTDSGRVRAFGEMVSLLCDRGQAAAALELEKLWNGLGRATPLMLLCAYSEDALTEAGRLHDSIVAQHARIFGPPGQPGR
ncbi:MAG TPA: MEDS domain-containing protein [Candidatus Thermoplasmatota archaeon]|nr:MEDS domain-containing protein [Candidatus Thermoplasmatota archaeon]